MDQSPRRRAIVLTVDGWGAGSLGPYGNTWLDTPACNQLANEGLLLEHAIVDSPSCDAFFQAVWSGRHAAFQGIPRAPSLPYKMAQWNQTSCLITDSRSVIEHPLTEGFSAAECVELERPRESAALAEQTQLARLLATAMASLEDEAADLTWIHSRGMRAAWDAPRDYREQFADEDDPPPPVDVEPPQGPIDRDLDPDDVQGWVWAYAAQVALLDGGLEALLESWRQIREPALLLVMGVRGYALAEHDGWCDPLSGLYGEHLHVPLIIASNSEDLARVRSQQLVQPFHVFQTLLDWFALEHPLHNRAESLLRLAAPSTSAAKAFPPLAISRSGELLAIRTPVWHACMLARSAEESTVPESAYDACQLFLKPDDRWEVNDVADRCPDVVQEFLALRDQLGPLPSDTQLRSLLPLHPSLMTPPE